MTLQGKIVTHLNQFAFDGIDLAKCDERAEKARQARKKNPAPGMSHARYLTHHPNPGKWLHPPNARNQLMVFPLPDFTTGFLAHCATSDCLGRRVRGIV